MKKIHLLLFLFSVLLIACAGSDKYQGNWKAVDQQGNRFDMVFSPKSFSVKDSTGAGEEFSYYQNSVNISNSVETYGIQTTDGRQYQIMFPLRDDESMGLVKDGNGVPLFTICRDKYLPYEQLYKLGD